MRKSYRKALSLALALATMLSLLAGCGNRSAGLGDSLGLDVDPAEVAMPLAEKATITGLTNFPANTESDPNNRTIFKRLEEQTNVHVEWKTIQSDQWGDTIKLEMSNAKTLPDFVFNAGFGEADLLKYGKPANMCQAPNYKDWEDICKGAKRE